MITIDDTINAGYGIFPGASESAADISSGFLADTVIFDIETTGFSPKSTHLYLIGAIYAKDGQIMLKQWFAENYMSESSVLCSFFEFIKPFRRISGYNISGFDIPYLLSKCISYNLPYNFDNMECIDLLREIKQISKLLKLPDLKQKSIENFLGITRKDRYSGGELITVYENYRQNPSEDAMHLLLLHNADDIRGLLGILPMRAYLQIANQNYTIDSLSINRVNEITQEAVFALKLPVRVPERVSCGFDAFYMTCFNDTLKIRCRIYSGELKYFYQNYKDYYYLPVEDRAMHKSVAFYVDKDFRTKAKASNCYSKKTGMFLPQSEEIISPYFKIDYYDKVMYFELTEEFRGDTQAQKQYIAHVINILLRN